MELVRENRGIHKSQICRVTGLSWGTVTHHLRVLQSANLVRCFHVGRRAHFATVEEVRTNRLGRALFLPHAQTILRLMEEGEVLGPAALAQRLDLSAKVIRRHCQMLIEDGHLATDGEYHPRFWRT